MTLIKKKNLYEKRKLEIIVFSDNPWSFTSISLKMLIFRNPDTNLHFHDKENSNINFHLYLWLTYAFKSIYKILFYLWWFKSFFPFKWFIFIVWLWFMIAFWCISTLIYELHYITNGNAPENVCKIEFETLRFPWKKKNILIIIIKIKKKNILDFIHILWEKIITILKWKHFLKYKYTHTFAIIYQSSIIFHDNKTS